jgi:hypothetical protein
VSKESRDFLLFIYLQRKNNIPIRVTAPRIPPITDSTWTLGLEDILAAAAPEDCAGASPACVGKEYAIVDTAAWLEYILWLVEACVMRASLSTAAEVAFDAYIDEIVGLGVGVRVDNIV